MPSIHRAIITFFSCLFLAFLVPSWVNSQPLDSLWSRTYGGILSDECYCVQPTSDRGYVWVGTTESYGAGETDVWLVKTDLDGNYQWDRTYGGTNWDFCYTVIQASDGGYVLPGRTSAMAPSDNSCWIIKTDASGIVVWETYFQENYGDFRSVLQLPDSSYLVVGSGAPGGSGTFNGWLLKLNSHGDSLWSRYYGGLGPDYFTSARQAADGGFVIGGYTETTGAGVSDYWIVKTDSVGNMQWSNTFGGSLIEQCHAILATNDGGYVLGGYTESFGAGIYDWWLVKTDGNGDSLWSRTYGGSEKDECWSMESTSDGGYFLAGHTESFGFGYLDEPDIWAVLTDSAGNELWNRTFGGWNSDQCYCVHRDGDDYALGGLTASSGEGSFDFYLIKLGTESGVPPRQPQQPTILGLHQNYPNPFNSTTCIDFSLLEPCHVLLRVFDIEGRIVATLSNDLFPAGDYSVKFDASDCASGNLMYQLITGSQVAGGKMTLLK
jgi:hypothetical protein